MHRESNGGYVLGRKLAKKIPTSEWLSSALTNWLINELTYRNQYDGIKIFLSLWLLEENVSTNSSFTKKENETLEAQESSGTKSMTMDESTLIKFRNNLFEVNL